MSERGGCGIMPQGPVGFQPTGEERRWLEAVGTQRPDAAATMIWHGVG